MESDSTLNLAAPIVPQVIQILRQAIVEMGLKPGEALSEKEVATRYGISRQPVREAFIKLAEAGLVQILPSRGTFVVRISVRDVLNARFLREAIECALVRTAAVVAQSADIERLENIVEEQCSAEASGDPARFYALDEAFHRALAEICECDAALRVVEGARAQMDRVRFLSLPEATPISTLIAQHRTIVEALARGDGTAAETAMKTHLREILSALPRLAGRYPDLFESTDAPAHARAMTGG